MVFSASVYAQDDPMVCVEDGLNWPSVCYETVCHQGEACWIDSLEECNWSMSNPSTDTKEKRHARLEKYRMQWNEWINPTPQTFVTQTVYEVKRIGGFTLFGVLKVQYLDKTAAVILEETILSSIFGRPVVRFKTKEVGGAVILRFSFYPAKSQNRIDSTSEFVRISKQLDGVVMYNFDDDPTTNSDRDFDDLVLEIKEVK
jgi:hypothetical protein